MHNEAMQTNRAQTLPIICLALMSSNFVYGVLAFIQSSSRVAPGPPNQAVTLVLSGLAGVALLAAAVLGMRLSPDQPFKAFQSGMILALAVAEAAAILGLLWFFLGGSLTGMAPFLGLALAVQGIFVLPKALAFRN